MPRPFGYKHSEETKKKIGLSNSIAMLGNKNCLGKKNTLGIRWKHSDESRRKMSVAKKGKVGNNKGKRWRLSKEIIDKMIGRNKGEKHPNWIKDRTKVKLYWTERNNPEYKRWRMNVWIRDGFKCKIANKDCGGRIEAHHILGWTEYVELRYEINNGITLCHAHHPRKRAEEKRLAPILKELVSVSKD